MGGSTCLVSNGLLVPPDKSGSERIHGDASPAELLGEASTCLREVCEFVSRRDECATVRWIEGVVPAIGCNNEVGLRPGTMKRPRTLHGANDIVTTLHDDSRNVANPRRIFEQLIIGPHETLVNEIMGL